MTTNIQRKNELFNPNIQMCFDVKFLPIFDVSAIITLSFIFEQNKHTLGNIQTYKNWQRSIQQF